MKNNSALWWFLTSFIGSLLLGMICTVYAGEGVVFPIVFIISLLISAAASLPVWIFAHVETRKGTDRKSVLYRIRNFQLFWYVLSLIGFGWPILADSAYEIEEPFWLVSGMITFYLLIGFAVWGYGYKSNDVPEEPPLEDAENTNDPS